MTLQAFKEGTDIAVNSGDSVTDFRGDTAVLVLATRQRFPGKSGKVLVEWPAEISGTTESFQCEYYDGVFGLEVREVEPEPISNEMVPSAEPFMRLT